MEGGEGKKKKREEHLRTSELLTIALFIFVAVNIILFLFGYRWTLMLSGSMKPEIIPGDLVLVRKADSINVGDIAVFRIGDETICHRVFEIRGDRVFTKGDSLGSTTEGIPSFMVGYKVVTVFGHPVKIPLLFLGLVLLVVIAWKVIGWTTSQLW